MAGSFPGTLLGSPRREAEGQDLIPTPAGPLLATLDPIGITLS